MARPSEPSQRVDSISNSDGHANSDALLSTHNVTKRFGNVIALSDVTLSIGRGVTGLVGANGAGKTTLMSIMLGIYPATSGRVSAFGIDPSQQRVQVNHRAAFVPERNLLPEEMKANDYVEHLARVRGIPRGSAKNLASDALTLVGLGEERFRPLGTMSTGQRQRVKMAQALAGSPDLVVLDEPTAGLDPAQRNAALDLITSVGSSMGVSFLISSHIMDEIERACTHVVALDAGRLIASGRISDVLNRRLPEYRVEFGEAMSEHDLRSIGTRVQHALPGTDIRVLPHAVDPTLLVRAPSDTPNDAVARACRDAVALENRRLRSCGPSRANLRDLFADIKSGTNPPPRSILDAQPDSSSEPEGSAGSLDPEGSASAWPLPSGNPVSIDPVATESDRRS